MRVQTARAGRPSSGDPTGLCSYPIRSIGAIAALAWLASCGGGTDAPDTAAASSERLQRQAIAAPALARWSAPIDLGFVPAAAANVAGGTGEGAGRVILWSSDSRFGFSVNGTTSPGVPTWTALFDPLTGTATAPRTQASGHNMFCPGTTNLPDGRLMVSGGSTSRVTSLYNPATDSWAQAGGSAMVIPRAYQANTLLRDGSVFTLGGSWNGGVGGKDGEVWTEASGWRRLSGVPVTPFLTADVGGQYRSDNHMWLFPTANGRVLHAGPSVNMNWISTAGNGLVTPAGRRADDSDAMQGSAVMFEPGRILVTGGAPQYEASPATANAFVIDARAELSVTRVPNMAFTRVFHNSVVLPSGEVLVIGGKDRSDAFNDDGARLVPELWDPRTQRFTAMPAMSIPRTYHGVAILMPDARVLSAGSGLCNCAADQPRAQVLTPHYLINDDGTPAVRPRITAAPTQAEFGSTLSVTTDGPIASFVLIRLSSVTHTVNNDQRRIPLTIRSVSGTSYVLDAPTNPGIALPGQYMLFALNADGVPSLARTVRIGAGSVPLVNPMADLTSSAGVAANATVQSTGSGMITYSASGLPPGLAISASTGAISGVPTTGGTYLVSVFAQNGNGRTSTDFVWRIQGGGTPPPGGFSARYLRLEQVSEVNGNPWAAMGELELLDSSFAPIPRTGWVASASSQETAAENGGAPNAIDGVPGTLWHSRWSTNPAAPPHWFTVDMGSTRSLGGLRYLPRQDGETNGNFARFNVLLSNDGVTWGAPIATGDFTTIGTPLSVKEVRFSGGATANRPPLLTTPTAQSGAVGTPVSLQINASDPDGDPLTWTASGLPAGLAIAPATGLITGTPTTSGSFTVTVSVSDGRGASAASTPFGWSIAPSAVPVIQPVRAPIATAGSSVSYTATATGTGLTYSWNFGDGSPATAFSSSPSTSRTYVAAGLYTVTLTVRSSSGGTATMSFIQAVASAAVAGRPSTSSQVAFEARTTGGSRVWMVNPDQNTVSVLDAAMNTRLAEVAVGTGPQTLAVAPNGWVWVVNRDSASLSIFQGGLTVAQTVALPPGSLPYGIAFGPDGRAYVTLEGTGELLRVNADRTLGPRVPVGANARDLAVTADGSRVLVSRFITPPLPGEGTAVVDVSPTRGGQLVSVLTASFSEQGIAVLRHSDRIDSSVQGRGIPNYLGAPALSPDGRSAWIPSKQDNIRRGTLRDGQPLDFQNTVRAISSRLDLSGTGTPVEDYPARVDHDNASLASAAVFHPSGAYLFVALETTRAIAVVDPAGRRELFRIPVGRAPQGLAVSADGLRLYASNFMDRTLSVVDLTRLVTFGESVTPVLSTVAMVPAERLPAAVFNGKRLFYDALDPRLSRDSYMSCATCHRDGGQDGRVWDLSSLGEGLRNTTALQGRAAMGHGALHWSGNFNELQDFETQIRQLAGGTGLLSDAPLNTGTRSQPYGDAKAGLSADLDALAAYVGSLNRFEPSPRRNTDRSLTVSAAAGRTLFTNLNCASCHGGTAFTNSSLTPTLANVGTLRATSGTRSGAALTGLDVPTLRDLWATAPYLHDGSAATVEAAIQAHAAVPQAAAIAALSPTELGQLADYLRQIGSEEVSAPAPAPVGGTFRYVRLEQLTEVNGNAWGSMADFNLLSPTGAVLPRTGWVATASSQETVGENGAAANALDASSATIWHTQWQAAVPRPPHTFTVDLGSAQSIGGFRYLPRQDGMTNGTIAQFRFYVSNDGVTWGSPVASGDFSTMGAVSAMKEVRFTLGPPPTNRPPVIATPAAQASVTGTALTLAIAASDPDGQPLTFSATGLPAGLAIAPATGVVSGTPTTAGTSSVRVTVSDGQGGSASTAAFSWVVSAPAPTNRPPVIATPVSQASTVGVAASLALAASDPDGNPLAFSATGLPAGLSIAPATGVISGIPTTAGTSSVRVTVTDGQGGSASTAAFSWVVSATAPVNRPPVVTTPAAQSSTVGVAASLSIAASDPDGNPLTFIATGLPAGLSIAAATGVVSGTPTTTGTSSVVVTVSDGRGGTASTSAFSWTIAAAPAPTGVRWVRLEQLTEVNGNPWGSMADFNLLSPTGAVLPRTGWVATASSQETAGENGAAANALDASSATIWHTQWQAAVPRPPHTFTVNLGSAQSIGGFRYLPRQDGVANGTIAQFRFYVSNDGVTWGSPVASGDFSTMGALSAMKEVRFTLGPPPANRPPVITTPTAPSSFIGTPVSLAIVASDPDGHPLTFSATGLPAGLSIAPTTGVVSGTPTTAGTSNVQITVNDGQGGIASTAVFPWVVGTTPPATTGVRWVRLEQVTEVNGNPWASMAEFNLLSPTGTVLPRTGWVATATSQETIDGSNVAANALDGSAATIWHTEYTLAVPRPPHFFVVNLGASTAIGGFRYLPRQDAEVNGTIAQFRFYVSNDGLTWGAPVASGDLSALGTGTAVREVRFTLP